MASAAEIAAMRRAIALSAAGLGMTSPNPPVGCVLLDPQDRIVGEGYHERKGEAHAEAQALAAAGPLAAGATAVVTLEPCNHQGRTPPCRQSLIGAGIRRVIIAIIDPTSRGEGGVVELRRAGVDVETGVLADEARVVLGDWLAGLSGAPTHHHLAVPDHRPGTRAAALGHRRSAAAAPERRCGAESGRRRPGGRARQPRDRHPRAERPATRDQRRGDRGRPVRRRCPPTAPRRRTRRRHAIPRCGPGRSRGGLPPAQERITASRCGVALAAPAARLRHHGHGQNRQLRPR